LGLDSDGERRGVFRLVLVVALLLPIAEEIIGTLVARAAFQTLEVFGPQGPQNADLVTLIDSVDSLVLFLVLTFGVFYFIGTKSGLEMSRDYLRLLEYTFVGSLIGYLVGFTASVGVVSYMYGEVFDLASLGLTTATYTINFVLEAVRGAIGSSLIAFAAISIGNLRRTPKIVDSAFPESSPNQDAEPGKPE